MDCAFGLQWQLWSKLKCMGLMSVAIAPWSQPIDTMADIQAVTTCLSKCPQQWWCAQWWNQYTKWFPPQQGYKFCSKILLWVSQLLPAKPLGPSWTQVKFQASHQTNHKTPAQGLPYFWVPLLNQPHWAMWCFQLLQEAWQNRYMLD